jgi:hypothetical protein
MRITAKFLKIIKQNQDILNIYYIPFFRNYFLIVENKENKKRVFLLVTKQQLNRIKKSGIKMIEDQFPKFSP